MSKIIFALDVPTLREAEKLVVLLEDQVAMFKVGLELFVKYGSATISMIKDLTDVGVFLDLKLHDIPTTINRTLEQIKKLDVDLTTVHVDALTDEVELTDNVIGVTVLTSEYIRLVTLLRKSVVAKEHGCKGVICSASEAPLIRDWCGKEFLTVTPGIRLNNSETHDQKRVSTHLEAAKAGVDYMVIGRAIRDSVYPRATAKMINEEIERGIV